ncbi:MAG: cell division protein FtsA [Bacteroidales bacterium]|jgi:cell division protein FtsA|nr:cell division protein FtsA [Bacteroidales bacterium]MCI2122229.1 cell division protein FtsA [Bacteroidales bacterium]MCI2145565.1 cell division protein FtsA [Bacteroidales bacterium]
MDSKQIAAIDFGTSATRVLLAEKCDTGINILGFSKVPSEGVKRGAVVNIQKACETLQKAVDEVREQTNVEIDEAMVSISGPLKKCETTMVSTTRAHPDSLITDIEIEELINNVIHSQEEEGSERLNVIPQKYDVDDMLGYSRNGVVGMSGKKISGYYRIVTGKSSLIRNIRDVLAHANIKPTLILLSPIAAACSTLSKDEKELGVTLLDIGAGTTELLVIKDNIIRHAAIIPFAGNSVTYDIRTSTGVSFNNAEIMKVKYGCCVENLVTENKIIVIPGQAGKQDKEISFKNLAHIIEARMTEIFEAVSYEIEQSGLQGKLPGGVVITGGTCYMERIQELANQILGYNIRLASPDLQRIHTNRFDEAVYSPNSSVDTGLALYYFENRKRIEESADIEVQYISRPSTQTDLFGYTDEKGNGKDTPRKVKKESRTRDKKEKNTRKGGFKDLFDDIFKSDDNEA